MISIRPGTAAPVKTATLPRFGHADHDHQPATAETRGNGNAEIVGNALVRLYSRIRTALGERFKTGHSVTLTSAIKPHGAKGFYVANRNALSLIRIPGLPRHKVVSGYVLKAEPENHKLNKALSGLNPDAEYEVTGTVEKAVNLFTGLGEMQVTGIRHKGVSGAIGKVYER